MRRRAAFFLAFAILSPASAFAEDAAPSREVVLKELETNRSMLARFEGEYALLKQLERDRSPGIRKELEGLKYKIEALKDETERLSGLLDEKAQANEFMKDVMAKSAMTDGPHAAVPGQERPTHGLHEKALALVSERRLGEAAKIYEDILLEDPDDDQAYLILGHCRLLSGDYARAQEAFMNAVHIDPSNLEEIVPFYENLAIQEPGDDALQTQLGYACIMTNDLPRARAAFRNALSLNSANADAARGLELADAAEMSS